MKLFLNLLVILVSTTLFSQTQHTKKNHFQTAGHVFKTSFKTIPNDFVYLGKEFSDDWKKTGYYAIGILGLIATDKITTKFYHNTIEPNIDYQLPNLAPQFLRNSNNVWISGGDNAYLTYPIIGMYFGSLFSNKERGQFAAINSFKAIAYSTLITQLTLKTIFGRNRPNRPINGPINKPFTNNNWDFFNARDGYLFGSPGGSSLPSMHTTGYFALAKVIQMEFDNYWIPYSIMAAAWLSDIKGHEHWVSDMVVGGILGTIIGRSIVRSSWKARGIMDTSKKGRLSLNYVPRISSEFTGLRIVGTF